MVIKAAVASSAVKSGDFLVVTEATTYYGDPTGRHRLSVISPTGSLRASLSLPGFGSRVKEKTVIHKTSISPDGKFAFTTASSVSGLKQMMYVTCLDGGTPKVVRTVAAPTSKRCVWIDAGQLAVDGPSRKGNYGIYVSRNCYDGCDYKSTGKTSSFEVIKLRYNPSTAKLVQNTKKPYISSRFPCSNKVYNKVYFQFSALQVIEGKPYGLMEDNLKGLELMELGSSVILAGSSSDYGDCDPESFVIASPNRIYGFCGNPFIDSYRKFPIFVQGSNITAAFPTSKEERVGLAGDLVARFFWVGSVAFKPLLRSSYAILQDRSNGRNNTLYQFAQESFGKPPVAIAKLDKSLLSPKGIPVAEEGMFAIRQLLAIP